MAKLTEKGYDNSIPIGVQGVQDYVDKMNREHPHSPYVWRVGERMHQSEQRIVKCVDVIRKSDLRHAGPRATPKDVLDVVSRNRLT